MGYGRFMEGVALSPEYRISLIPSSSLEIILNKFLLTMNMLNLMKADLKIHACVCIG